MNKILRFLKVIYNIFVNVLNIFRKIWKFDKFCFGGLNCMFLGIFIGNCVL